MGNMSCTEGIVQVELASMVVELQRCMDMHIYVTDACLLFCSSITYASTLEVLLVYVSLNLLCRHYLQLTNFLFFFLSWPAYWRRHWCSSCLWWTSGEEVWGGSVLRGSLPRRRSPGDGGRQEAGIFFLLYTAMQQHHSPLLIIREV